MESRKISLKAARVNAGLSQEQAAKELKVTRKTLQNWEKGLTEPNISQARAIEEVFRYPLSQIFFGSD